MRLLIKNVNIIDYKDNFFGDVYIEEGKITSIGKNIDKECEIIDGKGYKLLPAFVDLHSHFRDPGYTYKEDLYTGSKAAAKGGYTVVNLMANTNPVCSNTKVLSSIRNKAKEINIIDINQCMAITEDIKGENIDSLKEITRYDEIKFVSDDGKGVSDSKVMIEAMRVCKDKDITMISHAESQELSDIDMRLAENTMTWRDIVLAKFTGVKLHLAHVSTKESMKYIIEAKEEGSKVTCEVTPHHIALTSKTNYRVNPPLREEEDRKFLIKAIKDGYVDAIATDHAPHSKKDKEKGSPGLIGLESAFNVCYTTLVKEEGISINKLSEIMSYNPARIMGLNKGKISIGFDADFALVDTEKQCEIYEEDIISKSNNTPFIGFKGYGKILATIKGGKVIYKGDI
ncbi:dihydroorotase [Clostridium algidicarnis]|uniref:dihydroorotase n=1 Tax=Clostridium algidicarnis TaxID=37659 RepID=UPI001625755E|nr:dihydroorotase [Clostridium algidicarnis]MBB6631141.1 dihydroorotase [Clostridium algidicarnis]